MTKPDDVQWTPKENEEIAKRTNAILGKFTEPRSPKGTNGASQLECRPPCRVGANRRNRRGHCHQPPRDDRRHCVRPDARRGRKARRPRNRALSMTLPPPSSCASAAAGNPTPIGVSNLHDGWQGAIRNRAEMGRLSSLDLWFMATWIGFAIWALFGLSDMRVN
jgi:hypothetical protein